MEVIQMALEKAEHTESKEPFENTVNLLHKKHCLLGTKGFKTELFILLTHNEFSISC